LGGDLSGEDEPLIRGALILTDLQEWCDAAKMERPTPVCGETFSVTPLPELKPADRGIWASQLTSFRLDNAPGETDAALRLRRLDRKAGQNGDARYSAARSAGGAHPFASFWAACGANGVRGGHKTETRYWGKSAPQ
jgi:hypothetical protein